MTIAVVQKVLASGNLVTSITTAAISTSNGNLIEADAAVYQPLGVLNSITDNVSNVWNIAINSHMVGPFSTPDRSEISQYYVKNCIGSASYTITLGANGVTVIEIAVLEISGADTVSPLDATGIASTNLTVNHPVSTSGATVQADELVIAFIANFSVECIYSPDAAYTVQNEFGGGGSNNNGGLQETRVISATGVQTCTVTSNNICDSNIQIATYKAAAGGGPTPPKQLLTLGIG